MDKGFQHNFPLKHLAFIHCLRKSIFWKQSLDHCLMQQSIRGFLLHMQFRSPYYNIIKGYLIVECLTCILMVCVIDTHYQSPVSTIAVVAYFVRILHAIWSLSSVIICGLHFVKLLLFTIEIGKYPHLQLRHLGSSCTAALSLS